MCFLQIMIRIVTTLLLNIIMNRKLWAYYVLSSLTTVTGLKSYAYCLFQFFHCSGTRDWNLPRSRWWYVTVINCYGDGISDFVYNITMLNGNSPMNMHFSAEEMCKYTIFKII